MEHLRLFFIPMLLVFWVTACDQSADTTGVNQEELELLSKVDSIPLDTGRYRFDLISAKAGGQSLGEKVDVLIDGKSIKIIYDGTGERLPFKKRELIDQGIILQHKSGNWIIGKDVRDKLLNEIGDCTGGPRIIDLKNKQFIIC